jgi:hypothetical protein
VYTVHYTFYVYIEKFKKNLVYRKRNKPATLGSQTFPLVFCSFLVPLDLNKREKKLKLLETKRKHELAETEKLQRLTM